MTPRRNLVNVQGRAVCTWVTDQAEAAPTRSLSVGGSSVSRLRHSLPVPCLHAVAYSKLIKYAKRSCSSLTVSSSGMFSGISDFFRTLKSSRSRLRNE